MSNDTEKQLLTICSGIILAVCQYGLNVFSLVRLAHPEWLPVWGVISIVVGALITLGVFAVWGSLSKKAKGIYIIGSIVTVIILLSLCIAFRFKMSVTLFPSLEAYETVYHAWYIVFLIFGASFTQVLGIVILYSRSNVLAAIGSIVRRS